MIDCPGACNPTDSFKDSAKPPWLVLLVGYLLIHGVVETCSFALRIRNLDELLYLLPPFSFMHWYAYEYAWGWVLAVRSFLLWATPILGVFVARAIWRTPARTRRLVVVVAGAMALEAAIDALALSRYTQVYVTPIAFRLVHIPRLALSVFIIWFVSRIESRQKPEAMLVSTYLLLTGVGWLVGSIGNFVEEVSSSPLRLFGGFGSSSYVLAEWQFDGVAGPLLYLIAALLLHQAFPRLKTVAALLVFASVMSVATWLFRISTGAFGQFSWNWPAHVSLVLPIVGHVVIAVSLARFLLHNRQLFSTDEPLCRICRYNLTGNESGVCPECGTKL